MLHGKQFADWATPRPASTRSSPSLNDPLEMIKRGIIKSGSNVQDYTSASKITATSSSKEHAIDSSALSESQLIFQDQNFPDQGKNHHELPPKALVQAIASQKYAQNTLHSQGLKTTEEINQASKPSNMKYQDSGQHASGSSEWVVWATLKDNKKSNPQPPLQVQTISQSEQEKGFTYGDVVQCYSQSKFSEPRCLNENKNLEPIRVSSNKQNCVSSYTSININQTPSRDSQKQYNSYYPSKPSSCYEMQPTLSHVNALSSTSSLKPVNNKNSLQSCASGKWDHVMNAKDDLIRQKDIIIERQKQTIAQMQQHISEFEERFNQNSFLIISQRKEEEKHELERKDSQCQIAQLKAQLQQVTATKQEEIEKLQKKLGATEYELQKLEKGFKDVGRSKVKEITELERKIEERDVTDKNLKKSLAALQDSLNKERRKVHSLEQYLHDLPTADEHKKGIQQIKDLKSEKLTLEETIDSLEKRLKDFKDQIKEKDLHLQEERLCKEEVENKAKRLSDNLDRYKEREKDGPVSLEEYDEVKWENERIKAECERVKKLLEQKHKKMKSLHQQSQNTTKALEERLGQEEDTINTLRRDIESKDVTLQDLKTSVRQVSSENQDLMRENLALKDILSELERLTSKEVQQAHLQVQKELSVCVAEIKYLIQICSETAEGKDPNMSALLGIKGQHDDYDDSMDSRVSENPFGIEVAKIKLTKIRELRAEIDKLRTFVSDKYAEEVGNNCITQ